MQATSTIQRRQLIRLVGAGVLFGGLAGPAAARQGQYIVGTTTRAATREATRRASAVKRVLDFGPLGQAVAGRFTQEALRGLSRRPDVRYVEPDGLMYAIGIDGGNTELENSWGVDRVDAEKAHATDTGSGANIAIIDTGIDYTHSDLKANFESDRLGYDFVNEDDDPMDDNDHGTHCAGIAAAVDNGVGVVGVAPAATLYGVKVLNKDGSGYWSDVAAGITWAADNGMDVGSLSLGGGRSSSTVEQACQYAYSEGVLLVAAAGNDGRGRVSYPAKYETVVAVSATKKDDTLPWWSNTGSDIELAAPGVEIFSTIVGGYDTFSGTSMACPHVSGAGALLMADGYTAEGARTQLWNTAEDLGPAGKDKEYGYGLLDAEAAVGGSSDGITESDPTVDSLTLSEVEVDGNDDAEFDASWTVSDVDGDLSSIELTLYELDGSGTRVATEDSASQTVSGDSDSGTTRLVAAGDDGSGNTYEVEAVVADGSENTGSDTGRATESEDGGSGGDNAPTASIDEVTEVNSRNPHAEFDISWSANDEDGDLDTAELTLYDSVGGTEDAETVDISGANASGTTQLKAKHDDGSGNDYTVEIVVTDLKGNTGSDTTLFSEDGS